ncbi:MAG: SDR family oxidoreductase [Verrucomicrobiales bacterium]|nr:SDR family oxidoreductase [Verrucomicrobiales bacterium]
MKILVLGASGMIGSTFLSVLSRKPGWEVFGSVRDGGITTFFPDHIAERIFSGIDLGNLDQVIKVISKVQPNVVINCAGLTKHRLEAAIPLDSIMINSLLPHRIAEVCRLVGARIIHISTDCVFSGTKGGYIEKDVPDASDLYGRSKVLGELEYEHSVTLRTSTIGRELNTKHGLLEWFLSQKEECSGYRKAIFSGFPTSVFAGIVRDYVIPNDRLCGLYHVSAAPIDKFTLLTLIAEAYEKCIRIVPDDNLVIDRSLDSSRFTAATGYGPPEWSSLIHEMRNQPTL